MSNNWTIHIAENRGGAWSGRSFAGVEKTGGEPYPCYHCRTSFEISSWAVWLLENIPPAEMRSPDKAVRAVWVNKATVHTLDDFKSGVDVIMVVARHLKPLKFHEESWHPGRIAFSKAISAYLRELPDDWPCFLYET